MYTISSGIGDLMLIICHTRCLIFFNSVLLTLLPCSIYSAFERRSLYHFPSLQELLELGEKMGHVSTGLREEEIARSLRKIKHSVFGASARHLSTETEWKCSICQVGLLYLCFQKAEAFIPQWQMAKCFIFCHAGRI